MATVPDLPALYIGPSPSGTNLQVAKPSVIPRNAAGSSKLLKINSLRVEALVSWLRGFLVTWLVAFL